MKLIDITPILQAVIGLIAVVITSVVVPYIRSKTGEAAQESMKEWVKIAVKAAEQLYQGSGRGEEKKAYVLEWLQARGMTVDEELIDACIESAVYELTE